DRRIRKGIWSMMISTTSAKDLLLTVLIVAMVGVAARPMGLYAQNESSQEVPTQLDPPAPGISGGDIFRDLLQHNDMRSAELKQYSAIRTYKVTNTKGKLYARQIVQMDYRAPDTKMFMTTLEEGSGLVRHMVFKRLIESETETAAGKEQ